MPKLLHPNLPIGEIIHDWDVEEFIQYARSRAWYIFMIVIGLGLVIYGIFSNNFLFSLIVVLVAIILFLHSQQTPQQISFKISELGVIISNRFYSYDELENFFIIYNPPEVKMLFLETKNPLRPRIRVPLYDVNPVDVRNTLRAYLDEDTERKEEPVSDMVARQWRIL